MQSIRRSLGALMAVTAGALALSPGGNAFAAGLDDQLVHRGRGQLPYLPVSASFRTANGRPRGAHKAAVRAAAKRRNVVKHRARSRG